MYISKDGKYLVRGDILDLNANPFADVLGKIHLQGSPSKGPADAKVTVVDYSDYECPHCRELYMVEKEIIQPKYPQVRFVTKNFPLIEIHPWAMTAAIAAHCAFEHSNEAFWKVHDTIFDDQDLITPDNATDKLVEILGTAGIPADAARMCLAASGSKDAVEADLAEAKSLNADSTPTVFINGRELVGGDAATLQRYIDYDVRKNPQ
jgi:protein-disulfide isomerase